ncbi:uncharacterized protein [Procambarus clarkii]|uniref:uncharacterized protein n=1 Tax=Procambarus clarkii TaxID=6728 RepID=UPI003743C975
MTPGLSEDLLEVNDARKTAVINNELCRLQMNIAALQEIRLPATGSIREKNFTFCWQGNPPEEVREHGVSFAIRNRLLGSIVPPTEESARIIKLQLHTAAEMVSLISIYAPTLTSSTEGKDEFFDDLGLTLRHTSARATVMGDFNARVGSDHSSWPSCLGQTAPLKSATGEIIKDRDEQMNRWMEHYSEFYSSENLVSVEALDAIECLPIMEELDLEPTVEEVEKTLDLLSLGKAPGDDRIPTDVLKCARGTLKTELHELLCQCWREGSVTQDKRDANIITLYKNNGSDGNLYNLYRLRAKTKVQMQVLRVFPFADDA